MLVLFFFQAEDGIRDHCVTGVQTCALPISRPIACGLCRRQTPHAMGRAADDPVMADRTIQLVDVTLRDAHQCLWATRMTTAMMAELAPRLDRAGFEAIDLVGGAVVDGCPRLLRQDPLDRLRIVNGSGQEKP